MDILILESKLDSLIYNYIDNMYDINDINWTHPYEYDEEGNELENVNVLTFYRGDYDGPWDSDFVFTWIGINYYDSPEDEKLRGESPILEIHEDECQSLNGYFGDRWYGTFKRWFQEKFDLSVKTISEGLSY